MGAGSDTGRWVGPLPRPCRRRPPRTLAFAAWVRRVCSAIEQLDGPCVGSGVLSGPVLLIARLNRGEAPPAGLVEGPLS